MFQWFKKWLPLGNKSLKPTDRAPRIKLLSLQGVGFIPDPNLNMGSPVLADLSASGLAFQAVSFFRPIPVGTRIGGALTVKEKTYEVEIETIRTNDSVVAGPFIDAAIGLAEALSVVFQQEIEAVQMKRIDSNVLRQPDIGESIWLQSKSSELYAHTVENQVDAFQISFFGFYLEQTKDKELFIGSNPPSTEGASSTPANEDSRTDILTKSSEAQVAVLRLAIPFVNNALECPAWVRGVVVSQLNRELSERSKG